MEEENDKRGLFSIIPVKVMDDSRITAVEKLFYAEITSLVNERGYCYASNGWFGRKHKVSERTVTRWLDDLEKCDYIYREYEYYPDGKAIKSRKIFLKWVSKLALNDVKMSYPLDKNVIPMGDTDVIPGIDTNVRESNKSISNKKSNIYTPLVTKQKHSYGENKNVLLTDEEYEKLKAKFPDYESKINDLSYYLASKGAKYKSHYATILNWARKDEKKNDTSKLKGAGLKYVGVDMGF